MFHHDVRYSFQMAFYISVFPLTSLKQLVDMENFAHLKYF